MKKGIIYKGISGFYYVKSDGEIYECKARGSFRKEKVKPLVGDSVEFDVIDDDEKKGVIESINPRKSELVRPPVANIEKLFITFSVKEPEPNLSLLDRFIVFAEREGLDIIVLLTKIDMDTDGSTVESLRDEIQKIGYKVIALSSQTGEGMDILKDELKGTISAFAGQSGVGKSSLLNAINPDFLLETQSISKKLGRGKHTTRHVELFDIYDGAIVADTPGFSSFDITEIAPEDLKDYFIEFSSSEDCRFQNSCMHRDEPECTVKMRVENGEISSRRYSSYLQLLGELEENKKRQKW